MEIKDLEKQIKTATEEYVKNLKNQFPTANSGAFDNRGIIFEIGAKWVLENIVKDLINDYEDRLQNIYDKMAELKYE